jgi:hypothetical protein
MGMRPNLTYRLIQKTSSAEEWVLQKGTRVNTSLRIDTTRKLGGSTKIQAHTLPFLLFQRKEGVACDDILVIGQPLRKDL